MLIQRPRLGALSVAIDGDDRGAFGQAPFLAFDAEIARFGQKIELFVDLSAAVGASHDVSEAWTAWFRARRADLTRVHILVESRLLGLTVAIARHYSDTAGLITVHHERSTFPGPALDPGWRTAPAVPTPSSSSS